VSLLNIFRNCTDTIYKQYLIRHSAGGVLIVLPFEGTPRALVPSLRKVGQVTCVYVICAYLYLAI